MFEVLFVEASAVPGVTPATSNLRTLLVAPGIATRNKGITRNKKLHS